MKYCKIDSIHIAFEGDEKPILTEHDKEKLYKTIENMVQYPCTIHIHNTYLRSFYGKIPPFVFKFVKRLLKYEKPNHHEV